MGFTGENQQRYWKRIGYVAVECRMGEMVKFGGAGDDALDFKFSGTKAGDIYGKFNVSILGLSTDSIRLLTAWNVPYSTARRRRIQVFAGYEGDNLDNPIFDGFILTAFPTPPPDMWLNFECMRFYETNQPMIHKFDLKRSDLGEIAEWIANEVGLGWNEKNWISENKSPTDKVAFKFSGTKTQLMKEYGRLFGLKMYEQRGNLYVEDERPWLGMARHAIDVSIDTGLIGVTGVDVKGAKIKTRLRDDVDIYGWINLKSALIPSASGTYCAIRKNIVGHLRGNDWYTEFETVRRDALV